MNSIYSHSHCAKCHQGEGKARKKLDLTLRPRRGVFKEPYLTLVGPANYFGGKSNKPNCGIAGAIMAENCAQSDPASYTTVRPMTRSCGSSPAGWTRIAPTAATRKCAISPIPPPNSTPICLSRQRPKPPPASTDSTSRRTEVRPSAWPSSGPGRPGGNAGLALAISSSLRPAWRPLRGATCA